MKLASFERHGRPSYGVVKNGLIVDLGAKLKYRGLKGLLEADALSEARAFNDAQGEFAVSDVTFLPLIPDAGKILAIGLNYRAHAAEGGHEPPKKPVVFTRFLDTIVGHEQQMLKPHESEAFDWEVELCVVIGKPARRVQAKDALSYVAGYTVANDGSVRDWQKHGTQWTAGKNFYRSGAVGPWLVTAEDLPNPGVLRLTTRVNGDKVQDFNTSDLIFSVPELIEYITMFTPLAPGDMIMTGTPSGVGAWFKPQRFLKKGDVVETEVEGIGVLRNVIGVG